MGKSIRDRRGWDRGERGERGNDGWRERGRGKEAAPQFGYPPFGVVFGADGEAEAAFPEAQAIPPATAWNAAASKYAQKRLRKAEAARASEVPSGRGDAPQGADFGGNGRVGEPVCRMAAFPALPYLRPRPEKAQDAPKPPTAAPPQATVVRLREILPDSPPSEKEMQDPGFAAAIRAMAEGSRRFWYRCKSSDCVAYVGEARGDSVDEVYDKLRAVGIRAYQVVPWGEDLKVKDGPKYRVEPAKIARKVGKNERIVTVP